MKPKNTNAFVNWINEVGIISVAELLKVNTRTVHYWRDAHSFPRIKQMQSILKHTKGRVTYADILERKKGTVQR